MDLSKLSDSDLEAIAKNDMSAVSDAGLMALTGEQPQQPESTDMAPTAEAALQGVGQGLTLGYLPEIQARTAQGLQYILPESMGGGGNQSYEELKKEFKNREASLKQGSPSAYTAGLVGGSVALPLPGAGAAKGATVAARTAHAALKGAAVGGGIGGLQNIEDSENMSLKENLEERLDRAIKGAALGGALGAGFQSAAEGIKAIAKPAKEYLAGKVMGLQGQSAKAEKLIKQGKIEPLTKFMDEQGMLLPGATTKKVMEKSQKIIDDTGKEIGDVYSKIAKETAEGVNLENATPESINNFLKNQLDSQSVADDVIREAKQRLDIGEIDDAAFRAIENESNRLAKHGNSIEEFLRYRKGLDDRLNNVYKKQFVQDLTDKEEALLTMRRAVKTRMDNNIESIDQALSSKNSKLLKDLNDRYGKAKTLFDVSSKYETKGAAKSLIGLPETIAGGGAAGAIGGIPGVLGGIGTAIGLKTARKYGPGLGYQTLKGAEAAAKSAAPMMSTQKTVVPWLMMNREEK